MFLRDDLPFARKVPRALAFVTGLFVLGLTACNGCHSTPSASSAQGGADGSRASFGVPSLRLYLISDLAGALEPCGCTKNQLGGIDHLAAFLAAQKSAAPASLVIAAGPTLFLDPHLLPDRAAQDTWKAEAIGASLGDMDLSAWTPGYNDWAAGADALTGLAHAARGALLAANLEGQTAGAAKSIVRTVGGLSVGIIGIGAPALDGSAPAGVTIGDAVAALVREIAVVRSSGAQILVATAALPRGDALRIVDRVADLDVLLLGKPVDAGEANDVPPPPALLGKTLVVEASNHLQTAGVLDFFVRGKDLHFQDAAGIAQADRIASLSRRIADLSARIVAWENDTKVSAQDLASRRADLARIEQEKDQLMRPPIPASGSFFRYALTEIKESLGRDEHVSARMLEYYRRVNEHNKVAFAGRKPAPVAKGASGYVGVEVCSSCHEAERQVWDRTAHARAYATLATQFKEYNLDCVGCHVTGYEKPGGSTVTENASLRDVQCEQCHGPGQAHAKEPEKKGLIVRAPKAEACTSSCHHPPHVEAFDAVAARERILGPGHGMPDDAPWPAWATNPQGASPAAAGAAGAKGREPRDTRDP